MGQFGHLEFFTALGYFFTHWREKSVAPYWIDLSAILRSSTFQNAFRDTYNQRMD